MDLSLYDKSLFSSYFLYMYMNSQQFAYSLHLQDKWDEGDLENTQSYSDLCILKDMLPIEPTISYNHYL